jgi:hypothetical protein
MDADCSLYQARFPIFKKRDHRGSFAEVGHALLCFVVLWSEFATDIPRAWLNEINGLQLPNIQI